MALGYHFLCKPQKSQNANIELSENQANEIVNPVSDGKGVAENEVAPTDRQLVKDDEER